MTPNEGTRKVGSNFEEQPDRPPLAPVLDSSTDGGDRPSIVDTTVDLGIAPVDSVTHSTGFEQSFSAPIHAHVTRAQLAAELNIDRLYEACPNKVELPDLGKLPAPLPDHRKAELLIDAEIGLTRLEHKVALARRRAPKSRRLAGIEHEQSLVVVATGEPAFKEGPAVLEAIKDASLLNTTAELLEHQLERNGTPFKVEPGCLRNLERELREYDQEVAAITNPLGLELVGVGFLPSLTPEHMNMQTFSDGERYKQLAASLAEGMNNGSTHFSRSFDAKRGTSLTKLEPLREGEHKGKLVGYHKYGDVEFAVLNPNLALEGATSMQVHIDIPHISQVTSMHRVANMLSPAITAVTAASPFLLGEDTGLAEVRTPVSWAWSTSLFRFGDLLPNWMNKPTEQLDQAVRAGAIVEPAKGGKSSGVELEKEDEALFQVGKTVWPHNRVNFHFTERDDVTAEAARAINEPLPELDIDAVVENRCAAAAPTITDEVAHFAFIYFGITGTHSYLTERMGEKLNAPLQALDTKYHFDDSRSDLLRASADALDADFAHAPGNLNHTSGMPMSAREFIHETTIPLIRAHWMDLMSDTEEIDHYLQPIIDRLTFDWSTVPDLPAEFEGKIGAAPADILRYLNKTLPLRDPGCADKETRGRELTKLLVEMRRHDRESALENGTGSGILGWFKEYIKQYQ